MGCRYTRSVVMHPTQSSLKPEPDTVAAVKLNASGSVRYVASGHQQQEQTMTDSAGYTHLKFAGVDAGKLMKAVDSLLARPVSTSPTHRGTVAEPLTPRERYALSLVAELIETLRDDTEGEVSLPQRRTFRFGNVTLDTSRRLVIREGRAVHLAPREFELLHALAENAGAAVSRETLRRTVWKSTIAKDSRAIDQAISELRSKLEPDPTRPRYIVIAKKFGYRLDGEWQD